MDCQVLIIRHDLLNYVHLLCYPIMYIHAQGALQQYINLIGIALEVYMYKVH